MKNLTLKNGTTAVFLRRDDWHHPVYKLESGRVACCVNLDGTYLHSMSQDGEPLCPLRDEFQPVSNPAPVVDYSGEYMMLSRLMTDLDGYFSNDPLEFRRGKAGRLWAGSLDGQIDEIRKRWSALPANAKPDWLTPEQIDDYAKKAAVQNLTKEGV